MRLISPTGVHVRVADERAESLIADGYREPTTESAPAPAPKRARAPRRKSED